MINPSVLNAETHAWLSQFDHRPVGPLEATEITQVLSWAAGQLTLVCAASHDAAEISTLQATLSDIASAIQIYQQLGRDAECRPRNVISMPCRRNSRPPCRCSRPRCRQRPV